MLHMLRVLVAAACLLGAGQARAQPTFSVDFQGPSAGALDGFFGVPLTEGDVLTTTPPGAASTPNPPRFGPLPTPGIEIGATIGAVGVVPGGLGVLPSPAGPIELDALTYGRDAGTELHFSVDEFAAGVAGVAPDVFSEGALGSTEASADVFVYLGPVVSTPPGPGPGNAAVQDGDGLAPPGLRGVGLAEPNAPSVGSLPDPGDNLDAVDMDTTFADLTGAVFFSLDSSFADSLEVAPANSGTASFNGFSGADVLVSFAGGAPGVAIFASTLGLDLSGFDTDDVDALFFDDADNSGTLTAPDTIGFSVRRGSAVIGTLDSLYGEAIEPGDVLTVPTAAGLPPAILIPAEALGLGTVRSGTAGPHGPDDLDALDLVPAAPPKTPSGGILSLPLLAALLLRAATRSLSPRPVRLDRAGHVPS